MKRPDGMKGIDVSALSEEHHEKDSRKSRLLLEARILWERGQEAEALDAYAEVARLEEELMQEARDAGIWQKFFIHGFSAAHCWIKASNFYRARQLCHIILQQPDITPPLKERAGALLEGLQDGQRAYWASVQQRAAA